MIIIIICMALAIIYLVFKLYNLKYNLKKLNENLDFRKKNNSLTTLNISTNDREFKKLYNKINNLCVDINKKHNDYENLSTDYKKLMSNLSHDLRTPLTSIIGYLNLLEVDEKNREYLDIILKKAVFLNELIEKFYELSLVLEKENLEYEEFNLKELILEEAFNYFDKFVKKNQNLNLENIEDIKILSNKKSFESIVINLLDNMYKYSLGNNEIILNGQYNKFKLIFKNKIVYPDGEYDELFERSKVLDNSRKNSTGIGLSIVKANLDNLKLNSRIYVKDNFYYIEIMSNK